MIAIHRLRDIAMALYPTDTEEKSFHITFAIRKNRILSIGINKPRNTHPFNLNLDYKDIHGKRRSDLVGIHSELAVILKMRNMNINYNKITFYVMRLNKNKELVYSKPCSGCESLFNQIGYKDVFYSTNTGTFNKL